MKKRNVLYGLLTLSFLAGSVFAQSSWEEFESRRRFEIGTSVNISRSLLDTSLIHKFSPFFESGDYSSTGFQTLKMKGGQSIGFGAMIAYFPYDHFGVQILAQSVSVKLSGANSSYDVALQYTLRQPPDYIPKPRSFQTSTSWPATAGSMNEYCFSLNAAFRFYRTRNVSCRVSGGGTYFIINGDASAIGFTRFWMESYANLSYSTFQIPYKLEEENKIGFNIGGELEIRMNRQISAYFDARFYYCPKVQLSMTLIEDALFAAHMTVIKDRINLTPWELNPSLVTLNLGLKYSF